MMTLTPESDRTPAPTIGQELEREALTIGSTMQLFLRLRWWIAAVSAIGVFAWKGALTSPTATAATVSLESRVAALEHKMDRIDKNVSSLVKLACLEHGATSTEITILDIDCGALPAAPPDRTGTPRIRR